MKFATAAYMQPSFSMLHQTMYSLAALIVIKVVSLTSGYVVQQGPEIPVIFSLVILKVTFPVTSKQCFYNFGKYPYGCNYYYNFHTLLYNIGADFTNYTDIHYTNP